MALSLLCWAVQAEAGTSGGSGLLQKARQEDQALRADQKRLKLRHHVEKVIEGWQAAAQATSGAERIEAIQGELEAWRLLAHWSGRTDDQVRMRESQGRLEAEQAKRSVSKKKALEPKLERPPVPGKEKAYLTRVDAQSGSAEVTLKLVASRPFSSTRNRLPPKAGRAARIYFDLQPLIAAREVMGEVRVAHDQLERVRVGQFDDDTVRVVIDYKPGVEPEVLPEIEGELLRIGFGAPLAAAEPRAVEAEPDPVAAETPEPSSREALDNIVAEIKQAYPELKEDEDPTPSPSEAEPEIEVAEADEPGQPAGLKRSTQEASAPRLGSLLAIRRVVIDAGHGGKDQGALGAGGAKEKDVNLAIAKKLGAVLSKRGLKVIYTRNTDRFISLRERSSIANKSGADLFISVHANAHKKNRIHGIETYYLNTTSNRYAERLAHRENSLESGEEDGPEPEIAGQSDNEATELPSGAMGQDLRLLLADLAMRSAASESRRLAGYVQGTLVSALRRTHDDVVDLGVKHALFYVLLGTRMPSVLIETGFLTHPVEGRRLASDAYQDAAAEAIAAGVMRFVSERARVAARIGGEGAVATLARAEH